MVKAFNILSFGQGRLSLLRLIQLFNFSLYFSSNAHVLIFDDLNATPAIATYLIENSRRTHEVLILFVFSFDIISGLFLQLTSEGCVAIL